MFRLPRVDTPSQNCLKKLNMHILARYVYLDIFNLSKFRSRIVKLKNSPTIIIILYDEKNEGIYNDFYVYEVFGDIR